ncbi:MAG TPA: hypothetical protein VEQ60_32085 [Longimicrobium sp.]|nr:hypothetical protein [Longimicrobium sp.]
MSDSPQASQEGSDEAIIRTLVGSLFRAENGKPDEGDAAPDDVLAQDYLPITRKNGRRDESRQVTLDKIANASRSLTRHVDPKKIKVELFMEGRVAIAHTQLPTTDPTRTPPDQEFSNMHVFLKRDGGWKCVAWQVTEVTD